MNCKNCLPLLETYLDGELDARSAALVREHTSACESCAGAYRRLCREQEFYLEYECEAAASPSFWDGVSERIAVEKRARARGTFSGLGRRFSGVLDTLRAPRLSPAATAALALSAAGLTAGLMTYTGPYRRPAADATLVQNVVATATPPKITSGGDVSAASRQTDEGSDILAKTTGDAPRRQSEMPPARSDKVTNASHAESASRPRKTDTRRRADDPDTLVREAEQKYLAAINLLSRDVNRRRTPLDAETAARFRQTLAAVDRTIAGTRSAVRAHPDDPVAVQYMLTAYAKKVEILREMAAH